MLERPRLRYPRLLLELQKRNSSEWTLCTSPPRTWASHSETWTWTRTGERLPELSENAFTRARSYVGAAEIAHVLKQIGERVTDDEVDEMILMGDLDGAPAASASPPALLSTPPGDGQVSFEEFSNLMQTLALPRSSQSPQVVRSRVPSAPPSLPEEPGNNALQVRLQSACHTLAS